MKNKTFDFTEVFSQQSEIEQFRQLSELRDILKKVQQMSWNINAVDKKYPLEQIPQKNFKDLLSVYLDFGDQIITLAKTIEDNYY